MNARGEASRVAGDGEQGAAGCGCCLLIGVVVLCFWGCGQINSIKNYRDLKILDEEDRAFMNARAPGVQPLLDELEAKLQEQDKELEVRRKALSRHGGNPFDDPRLKELSSAHQKIKDAHGDLKRARDGALLARTDTDDRARAALQNALRVHREVQARMQDLREGRDTSAPKTDEKARRDKEK